MRLLKIQRNPQTRCSRTLQADGAVRLQPGITSINAGAKYSIHTAATEVIELKVMKTKTLRQLAGYIAALALCSGMCASASAQTQTNKLRIGVNDSRAIAIAYGNSAEFQQSVKSARTEYNKARRKRTTSG